jgi:methylenetetrahydrofolate--tRNA-(uracil-5-)-methyltransferase
VVEQPHAEMRELGFNHHGQRPPPGAAGGGAPAVDSWLSQRVSDSEAGGVPAITIEREEIADTDMGWSSPPAPHFTRAAEAILKLTGEGESSFFDAIAPIVHAVS